MAKANSDGVDIRYDLPGTCRILARCRQTADWQSSCAEKWWPGTTAEVPNGRSTDSAEGQ